jgi:adenylate kinase
MTPVQNKLVFVMLGPPGSGKGTQAEQISKSFNLYHIDTGAALRREIQEKSDVGQLAQSFMDKGQLVPSDVVQGVIEAAMKRIKPEQTGYLMDGFPRNLEQAQGLEGILKKLGQQLTSVFYLDMPMADLFDRLAFRLSCPNCGAKYNSKLNAPKIENTCDVCQTTPLTSRKDDAPEVIQPRLAAYQAETEPLVAYYNERNLTERIEALQPIDDIFKDLSARIQTHIQAQNACTSGALGA